MDNRIPLRARPTAVAKAAERSPLLTDRLWGEFGWALSASTVAAIVGAIAILSCGARLLGL